MSTVTDWISASDTAVGSLAVIIGLGATAYQISLTRQTVQATTVYNIEKDFNEIFGKRVDKKFTECYRPSSDQSKSGGGLALPAICPDPDARETFFDILSLYRMLLDLAKLNAVPEGYLNARIQAFCAYLTSPAGLSNMEDFQKDGRLREDLLLKIKSQCQSKK